MDLEERTFCEPSGGCFGGTGDTAPFAKGGEEGPSFGRGWLSTLYRRPFDAWTL